ncbi:recombinase family protein [Sinomonas humi]|uniref:recombinase family protein n=1 Tax=Sinomonas humi TaxID=1338436 RepID=UPI00068979C9|nr:recombinase family protein [Sinomonas humi]
MGSAIYVRQSKDRTGDAVAVERQLKNCTKLAEAKGWGKPRVFRDNDRSATSGKIREGFEELIRAIAAGEVTQLAVWHLDRLSRSMRDLQRVIDAGKPHALEVASVHGTSLNLADPSGIAVSQILTSIAAMEVAHKAERQKTANRQRAEAGRAFWVRRPFGYGRDESGKVFVVEAEAQAIKDGVQAVLSGGSISDVARDWNARGLRTSAKNSSGRWSPTPVRRVLLNPMHPGRRFYLGEDVATGEWPPILTEEQHDEIVRLLKDPRRKTSPVVSSAKHLLSGILLCGKCGGPMYEGPGKGTANDARAYRCRKGCTQRTAGLVEEAVEAVIVRRLSQPDIASRLVRSDRVAELRGEAVRLREKRASLVRLLSEELVTEADVRDDLQRIRKRLAEIEGELDRATVTDPLSAFVGTEDAAAAWAATPLEDQRKILRQLAAITMLPAGRGVRFSPEQVRFDWKETS